MSTMCRHSFRVVAFLQAVVRPKFSGPRSASIAQSQVRYLSDSRCETSVMILAMCTTRNVAKELQISIS